MIGMACVLNTGESGQHNMWLKEQREKVDRWIGKLVRYHEKKKYRAAFKELQAAHFGEYDWSPHYTVMSAMRSCDTQMFPDLKTHITARLRSIYFPATEAGEWKDEPLTQQTVDDLSSMYQRYLELTKMEETFFTVEVNVAFRHWANHTYDAVLVTMNHPVWGGQAVRLCALLKNMIEWMHMAHLRHYHDFMRLREVNAAVYNGHYVIAERKDT